MKGDQIDGSEYLRVKLFCFLWFYCGLSVGDKIHIQISCRRLFKLYLRCNGLYWRASRTIKRQNHENRRLSIHTQITSDQRQRWVRGHDQLQNRDPGGLCKLSDEDNLVSRDRSWTMCPHSNVNLER